MFKNSSYKPYNYDSNDTRYNEFNESGELCNAVKQSIKMDNALQQYYLKMGRNDYRNKFLNFFVENEYDCEDIEDELGDDIEAQNCSYIEFDDNFPLDPSIKNVQEKQQETFRILQNCYKYGKASKTQMKFQLTHNFMKTYQIGGKIYDLRINLNENEVNFGLQIYKQQCKYSFANKAVTDNGMAYSFGVGVMNNNFPFLQNLLDIYMRDSLQCALYYNTYISNDCIYDVHTLNDYHIVDWAEKYRLREHICVNNGDGILDYKHYLGGNIYDGILSGMDKYLRICPRLHINPLMLIKDDIYSIAKYFLQAYEIIKYIINNNESKDINFQFDFAISCAKSVQKKGSCFPALWSDLSDTSNDGDDMDGIDGGIKWTTDELKDCIGDINSKLISNECIFVKNRLTANKMPENSETLQLINDQNDVMILFNVCQKYLTYDYENKRNRIINLSSFEYRKQRERLCTEYYDNLCDGIERLKVLSLQNIMDEIYPEMNINRIIFEILDYEMSDETIYLLLNNLIGKNINDSFSENKHTIFKTYNQFKLKLNIDSEFGYPTGSRFCAIVDRRNEKDYKYGNNSNVNSNESYCDTIYFFQPKQCKFIPLHCAKNILPEWYLNATQTSFIPKFNSNNNYFDKNEKEYCDRYRKNQKKAITSHSLCNGALLMLSFIIESKDVIKCYLFRDSTFIRFFPRDIIDVLPKLFVSQYANNYRFEQDNLAQVIADKMQYTDQNFQYWYNNGEC